MSLFYLLDLPKIVYNGFFIVEDIIYRKNNQNLLKCPHDKICLNIHHILSCYSRNLTKKV